MTRIAVLALTLVMASLPAHAQEEGRIPAAPPLIAHFTDEQGRLLIGGGPEAEDIAVSVGGSVQARIVGALGAVPLLAQGVIALAVLPRDLTVNERAATRRFTGMRPLAVPILKGLTVYARRDTAGAVDERVLALVRGLLTDDGQARLAERQAAARLSPAELAAARVSLKDIPTHREPDAPASSRLADGTKAIIGSDTLTTVLPDLLAGFAKRDPHTRFVTDLRGSSLALPALTADMTAMAPMGREAWQDDVDAFRQVKGYAPTRIRIAYASHGPRPRGKTPPAIYINSANPLRHLTLDQIRRIFASGAPGGDIADWRALGVAAGQWEHASIHVYGGREDGGFAQAMRQSKLNGLPFTPRYRSMANGNAIVQAVAADPLGIGYATWMDDGEIPRGVRIVPLAKDDAGPFVTPDDIERRGAWPISYFFNIYIDRAPTRPLAPELKALLTYILSDEGQVIIAAHSDEEDGYVPLDARDLAAERQIIAGL